MSWQQSVNELNVLNAGLVGNAHRIEALLLVPGEKSCFDNIECAEDEQLENLDDRCH